MNFRTARLGFALFCAALILAGVENRGMCVPQSVPPPGVFNAQPVPVLAHPAPQTNLLDLLQWDARQKEQAPVPGSKSADFVFAVTNTSEVPVTIQRVQTSCGCTVAKLPSEPWVLAPHTNGEIKVSVNLAGKFGVFSKAITVYAPNDSAKTVLTVQVTLPNHRAADSATMDRARNQQMAMADQQAVFKGDCAKCHLEPTKGKMGKPLYVAACGICHEANPRASMVPDLHALNHPTFYGYWKMIITDGKPKSLMPAFGQAHGGPLTEEQIDSLAKVLTAAYSSPGVGPAFPLPRTNAMLKIPGSGLRPPPPMAN